MIDIKQQGYYIEASYGDIATMWGWTDENFIHLIRGDVDEAHRQEGIMTKLIKAVQEIYPDAELSFQALSKEGIEFVTSSFPEAKVRPWIDQQYKKMTVCEYIEYLKKQDVPTGDSRGTNYNGNQLDNPCGCGDN